jgi:hypothetical protein
MVGGRRGAADVVEAIDGDEPAFQHRDPPAGRAAARGEYRNPAASTACSRADGAWRAEAAATTSADLVIGGCGAPRPSKGVPLAGEVLTR